MTEAEVHDLIITNDITRNSINNILSVSNSSKYIHEDTYINGITADFTVIEKDRVVSIIECKGSDIGVTDYVRGIGQSLQYEYFFENKISKKGYEFSSDCITILLFPSSVIRDNSFNIGNFKYPKSTILLELNETNNVARKIEDSELKKLRNATVKKFVTISPYYFRDNRIYEDYILLKYLGLLHFKGKSLLNRKELEDFLKKAETHNPNNWRNAFITLSSLGLIDSKNLPTPYGINMGHMSFEDFAINILSSHIKPYVDEIYACFNDKAYIEIGNKDIKAIITKKYNDRDILFLTESDARYISSWMSILRDDYGCILFEAKSSKRTIVYNPLELNEETLRKKIKENSIAYKYIDKFNKLIEGV